MANVLAASYTTYEQIMSVPTSLEVGLAKWVFLAVVVAVLIAAAAAAAAVVVVVEEEELVLSLLLLVPRVLHPKKYLTPE